MRSRHIFGMLLAGFVVAIGCGDSGDGDGDGGGAGTAASGGDAGDASAGGGSGGTSATGGIAGSGTGGAAATGAVAGEGGEAGGGGVAGGGEAGGGGVAGGVVDAGPCVPLTCQGKIYQCGDCIDNDGDGKIDMDDPDCLGPCHNAEDTFYGSIPGQAGPACTIDCYFDQDSGAGNDKCCWDHRCDPLSVAPLYPPEGPGNKCEYMGPAKTATYKPSCSQKTCDQLYDKAKGGQDPICENFCGPLTPNGCDCFGCCELPAHSGKFVWLGSEDTSGKGSCDLASVSDPTKCQPCTPVPSCLNTCEKCELCLGKTELPAECFPPPPDAGVGGSSGTGGTGGTGGTSTGGSSGSCGGQICPPGAQPCGLSCQPPCPNGFFCNTGCCVAVPS
jgi:hypothetical protein